MAFFESKIRPLLVERCYECHGEKKQKAEACAFDSRAAWQKGGDTGATVTPGDPEASLLIKAVRYGDKDLQMPPKRQLAPEQIAALEEWVKLGAPDPRTEKSVAARGIDMERRAASIGPINRSGTRSRRCFRRTSGASRVWIALSWRDFSEANLELQPARRPADIDPACDVRSHRPAADRRRGERLRQRSCPRCVCEGRGSPPRVAALRRALGAPLAGRGPLLPDTKGYVYAREEKPLCPPRGRIATGSCARSMTTCPMTASSCLQMVIAADQVEPADSPHSWPRWVTSRLAGVSSV